MEKKLKVYIIFLIIFIILISIIILLCYKKLERNEINNIDGDSFEIKPENNNVEVSSNDEFYNIRNCIQCYIGYIIDENFEAVLKVLDENYTNQNSIEIESLKEKFKNYNKTNFIVNTMKKREIDLDLIIYYVEGYLANENYSIIENGSFTVLVDGQKELFSIIPENLEKESNYKYNTNLKIDADYYNKIIYETFSNAEIIKEYFNLYKNLANNNIELAYSLLNSEYKEKRFNNSIEKYEKFLKEVNMKNSYLSKFAYNSYEEYSEYIGIDKNGLYYIFRETSPMNFELLLDTYTIQTEKFINSYKLADNKNRVMMNVEKFVMMINNRDYETAYNLLDNTFKRNNFPTVQDFEEYIKNRYPSFYEINYSSFEIKGANTFVQKIQLKDINNEDIELLDLNLIIKLEENVDFVMSFEI